MKSALLLLITLVTTASAEPLSITGADGETLTLAETPRRVIIAGRGSVMILHAAALFPSAADRVIAVSGGRQLRQEQIDLFTRGGNLPANLRILPGEAGPEQLAPLRPDLVVLKHGTSRLREALGRIGIPAITVDLETPDAFERDLRNLGIILGDSARADALLDFYRSRQQAVTDRLATLEPAHRPRVLLLQSSLRGGTRSYSVPGADWMQTAMVEMAGGDPVWKAAATLNNWSVTGLEQIAVWNPDVVFVVDYDDPDRAVEMLRNDASWRLLRAVQHNRVYAVPSDSITWDQPDPRWILGLTWMARTLHPDRFNDADPHGELAAFHAWYGITDADVRTGIEPRIRGDWP